MIDLASAIGADPGNTAREVARLENAGIMTARRVGRTKLVRANADAPFYRPLFELIMIVLGPATVLAEHLGDIEGIVFADIFGSWAARYHGESGPQPADIDRWWSVPRTATTCTTPRRRQHATSTVR